MIHTNIISLLKTSLASSSSSQIWKSCSSEKRKSCSSEKRKSSSSENGKSSSSENGKSCSSEKRKSCSSEKTEESLLPGGMSFRMLVIPLLRSSMSVIRAMAFYLTVDSRLADEFDRKKGNLQISLATPIIFLQRMESCRSGLWF